MNSRTPATPSKTVSAAMISIASVCLVGIILIAVGWSSGNRVLWYIGLMVTLVGVFAGIQRVALRGSPTNRP